MNDTYMAGARELEAELVQFMQDIIRIPSLSSEEGAVIKRIHDEMLKLGYDEVRIDPMGNVLGRIGGRRGRCGGGGQTALHNLGERAILLQL